MIITDVSGFSEQAREIFSLNIGEMLNIKGASNSEELQMI